MAYADRLTSVPRSFSGRTGVLLLLAQGLAAKALMFNRVAVNGDTGLYIYDSMQILWGHQMFVDFPGRSPVVQYVLAAVLAVTQALPFHVGRLEATRSMMICIGLLAGVAVYLLTRELAGDRAGLVAMALYVLTPFDLTWGIWMKTEIFAALLGTLSMYLAVKALDQERPPAYLPVGVGVLFALTLLARRVAIVFILALVLYTFWYRHRRESFPVRSTLRLGLITAAAGLGTIVAALFIMAGGEPVLTWKFFDMYFIDLFRSGGFGAHGYLPLFGDSYVHQQYANARPDTFFQTICQKCGQRTILVFTTTIMASLITIIPLLLWLRAYFRKSPIVWFRWFLPAMLFTQAAFGIVYIIATGGFVLSTKLVALVVFAAAVLYIWNVDTPEWADLAKPRTGLIMLVLVLLAASYLYRDRILYPTYWQDFYPYVAVLGGIALTETWAILGPVDRPSLNARRVRKLGAIIIILAFYASALGAYPYIGDHPGSYTNWYTTNRVEAYGWDINQQLAPGDRVFAANPLIVVDSHHRLVDDLSRKYYLFEGWPSTHVAHRLGGRLTADIQSDDVPMAFMTPELRTVLAANATLNATFHREFCYVHDPLYESGDSKKLYVKRDDPSMPACGADVVRREEVLKQLS